VFTNILSSARLNFTTQTIAGLNSPSQTIASTIAPEATKLHSGSPCLQSWDSWIDHAVGLDKSTGTITSQSFRTTTIPEASTTYLDLCETYQKCQNTIRVEVASSRLLPPPTTIKTLNFHAEPSLSALINPPPRCSLLGDECADSWGKIAARGPSYPIWRIAADLGPYLESIGVPLFGCSIPQPEIDRCMVDEKIDLGSYLSTNPRNSCTKSSPSPESAAGEGRKVISPSSDNLRGMVAYMIL
jgi:hypothetical protein